MQKQTLHFRIDAEFFTKHVRELWHEGKCVYAYRLLKENLIGIPEDVIFDILSGKSKFANDEDSFVVEPDNWSPEKNHLLNYPTPSMEGMLDRMQDFEKFAKHFSVIKALSPLAHSANGIKTRSGPVSHASPIGFVHHEYLTFMLCKMLPPPTDEEWKYFWNQYTDQMKKDLDIRPGEDSIEKSIRELRESLGEDTDEEQDEKSSFVSNLLEAESDPIPEPDQFKEFSSGYILPDGKFYGCKYMGHRNLSAKLLEKQGITEYSDSEKEADDRGWVRINNNMTGFYVMIETNPTRKQKDSVQMWLSYRTFDIAAMQIDERLRPDNT